MVNGNNGETTLLVVMPQVVEEPKTGFIPQAQAQPVVGLFGDQQIFVSAPQYNRHVQGVLGANNKARHHINAFAQRLHQFGHAQKKERWNCGTG